MQSEAVAIRIGEIVRAERKRQQLTQQELALAAGVSYRTVLQIEKGKSTSRMDVVLRVLETLGLTLEVRAAPRSLAQSASQPLGLFVIDFERNAHVWRLKAASGEVLARSSNQYLSREDAERAVRRFIALADANRRNERSLEISSTRRAYRWRLTALDGESLATSDETYESRRAAQSAAHHALLAAAAAEID